MDFDRNFRFIDQRLQQEVLTRIARTGVAHEIGEDGMLHYASVDAEVVENDLICSIRDTVFPAWSIFTVEGCGLAPDPLETGKYRDYMRTHHIPFVEEVHDTERWFLIPDPYDSFAWNVS
jgi:hypothetical protein